MRKTGVLDITPITIGTVLSFLILILGWINFFDPLRSFIIYVTNNIIISTNTRVKKFENFFYVFDKINEVSDENDNFRKRIIELESENIEKENQINNISFVIENNLTEFDPQRELIGARIISYDRDQSGKAYINRGITDGIAKGDILVIGSFAVGEIENVSQNFSEIKIIASSNYRINVVTLESGTRGILEGSLGGEIKVVDVLNEDPLKVDDIFVTEGKDNKYPYGLYVGKVEKVISAAAEPTKSAILTNSLNFKSLDRIYVMRFK